ncbi:helix-turn-helix domain-containing protein [Aquipuribacter sp. MA13-6]|uniref:helix-turn-helix domain-containing protein n=1 Tax=unclassified Aquipuribacter TaxID=2635084 RepID=UPI003EEEDD01
MVEIKKGVRLTGTERDTLSSRLVAEYEQGASIRSLAESTGRSYGFVHRVLSESEVKLRSRGGATRGRAKAADS